MQPSNSPFVLERGCVPRLLFAILLSAYTAALSATPAVSGATAQVTPGAAVDQASPADIVTGPDFRALMKIMRRNIVACGVPRTAVLHWHVMADGVIDNFVLNKSSGDACFDEIVILNADAVVKAKLRVTPATRVGVAQAAWVPFSVAARD